MRAIVAIAALLIATGHKVTISYDPSGGLARRRSRIAPTCRAPASASP